MDGLSQLFTVNVLAPFVLAFDRDVRTTAVDHYRRGVRIGELSLSENFEDVLPWGLIDNWPFLRC
jgi:hypothetical protein